MPTPPPFARGRQWRWRASQIKKLGKRVWYDPQTRHEYDVDPRKNGVWHEIDPRSGEYRDVDPLTGQPVAGAEGRWRPLH
jgi:hypothetical protein